MREKKLLQHTNRVSQIIMKEYKGKFCNYFVEVTFFIQGKKVKQRKRYRCYK